MSLRAASLVLLTAGLVGAVAGCSAGSTATPPAETSPSEASPLEASAAQARDAGVDADQLDVLESGAVEFEDYELAMNRAYECMRDAGATVDVRGVKRYHGVTVVDASTQEPAGSAGVVDDCYRRHAQYVDAYWQASSPDAVAYAERRAVALRPALRDCLTEQGVDWPEDASFGDLTNLAFGPGLDPESNCLEQIGYPAWDG